MKLNERQEKYLRKLVKEEIKNLKEITDASYDMVDELIDQFGHEKILSELMKYLSDGQLQDFYDNFIRLHDLDVDEFGNAQ